MFHQAVHQRDAAQAQTACMHAQCLKCMVTDITSYRTTGSGLLHEIRTQSEYLQCRMRTTEIYRIPQREMSHPKHTHTLSRTQT